MGFMLPAALGYGAYAAYQAEKAKTPEMEAKRRANRREDLLDAGGGSADMGYGAYEIPRYEDTIPAKPAVVAPLAPPAAVPPPTPVKPDKKKAVPTEKVPVDYVPQYIQPPEAPVSRAITLDDAIARAGNPSAISSMGGVLAMTDLAGAAYRGAQDADERALALHKIQTGALPHYNAANLTQAMAPEDINLKRAHTDYYKQQGVAGETAHALEKRKIAALDIMPKEDIPTALFPTIARRESQDEMWDKQIEAARQAGDPKLVQQIAGYIAEQRKDKNHPKALYARSVAQSMERQSK